MYQNQIGTDRCKLCPAGFYQNEKEKTECKKCNAGKYGVCNELTEENCEEQTKHDISACIFCPKGKYSDVSGAKLKDCKSDCKAGNYINAAQTSCVTCPKGQYQDVPQMHSCKVDCMGGNYISDTATCSNCEIGKWQPDINQPKCRDDCDLKNGYYIPDNQTSCLRSSNCVNTFGKQENLNIFSCFCNRLVCDSKSGMFCTVRYNKCSKGPLSCGSGVVAFDPEYCDMVTDRCECSKCVTGYYGSTCVKCPSTDSETIVYIEIFVTLTGL